jgi:putative transposase
MSHDYYSEINLHLTWHTKDSLPLLTATVEPWMHRYLRQRLLAMESVFVHEVGGIETHIHVALTVPPTVSISELVGQLKGASSHEANQQFGLHGKVLQWQAGYGVVSFGTRDIDWVKEYVRNQRKHHAAGKVYERLEQIVKMDR